jgi:uncharacterized protein involved in response to NO
MLFFPLGIALAWAGVAHWYLLSIGAIENYRPIFHSMAQIQGFMTCFAAGFLLTMIPRRTGSDPPAGWQIAVCAVAPFPLEPPAADPMPHPVGITAATSTAIVDMEKARAGLVAGIWSPPRVPRRWSSGDTLVRSRRPGLTAHSGPDAAMRSSTSANSVRNSS